MRMSLEAWEQQVTGLKAVAASWYTLAAWRPVDMRNVRLAVKFRPGWCSTGLCRTSARDGVVDVLVRLGADRADGMAALLHELAHAAAQRRGHSGHDAGWRRILIAAAFEVLGVRISDEGGNRPLTDRVADAFRDKWQLKLGAGHRETITEEERDESAHRYYPDEGGEKA